ncbi:MAG: cytidine deaminase, partial [Clostridia bacterium]|nr:cytidine deaminase [Clostridia bacterium]
AVSNAYQAGEREFKYLMAVKLKNGTNEFYIIPPCGICREMFKELEMSDLQVVFKQDEKYYTKTISELLPES